jgi:hypothetical protein
MARKVTKIPGSVIITRFRHRFFTEVEHIRKSDYYATGPAIRYASDELLVVLEVLSRACPRTQKEEQYLTRVMNSHGQTGYGWFFESEFR